MWPVISFVIFFLFFLGLLWWVFTVDKKFIDEMKNLPIDKSSDLSSVNLKNQQI
jgi:cytochrome c oxidase cbb3-type subunit 4